LNPGPQGPGFSVFIPRLAALGDLPVAAYKTQLGPHQRQALQGLFDVMLTSVTPTLVIEVKHYDSDPLDAALAA
jgi:hypothetical protein